MRRELFLYLADSVCVYDPRVCASDPRFVQKHDALGRLGLSNLQKCIVVVWMLAYNGLPTDACDEYVHKGETIALMAMRDWVNAI